MHFYAHSGSLNNHDDWQLLVDHSKTVGSIAARNASWFGAEMIARYMGELHDVGKYSLPYLQRLHGGTRLDHATAGAKIVMQQLGKTSPLAKLMAYGIAGHHAGLANGIEEGVERSTLQTRLNLQFGTDIPALDITWQTEINLPSTLPVPAIKPANNSAFHGFQLAFLTRMLYSCLVDADFLDTEKFYAQLEGTECVRGDYPKLQVLQTTLNHYVADLQNKAMQSNPGCLNDTRKHILDTCRQRALSLKPGLFTLTVPTGGGKTLASMAFALDHALANDLRRVIYVIPFTSIIEQNAKVFRKAFGEWGEAAVLEHHSAFDDSSLKQQHTRDKLRLAMENWDYPVIVTTAVQFFESLFADRASPCRKLHNIAGSVIILDEAQVLPLHLLRPIMAAIDELARNYRCSIVLCTATQPALLAEKGFYNGFTNVCELAPNPQSLFEQLKRVIIRYIGLQSDEQLTQKIQEYEQLLVIVNNRRHARELYQRIRHLPGAYHLTTLMCAKHRSEVLARIRAELTAGRACRVVSTSLIEAGVDVDFPCVMRAEAGLDSIAQAAGRCNREGKRKAEDSEVFVFQAEEVWKAPPELGALTAAMREVVRHHSHDLLSLSALERYFSQVYWQKGSELDREKLLEKHSAGAHSLDFSFQTIARKFCMIESHLLPVIIPFDNQAQNLLERLQYAEHSGYIARALQPYVVQIPERALQELQHHGRVEWIELEKFGKQFCTLIGLDLYDPVAGLRWENPDFIQGENLFI